MEKFVIQALLMLLPVICSYGQITKEDSLVLENEKWFLLKIN